MKILLTSCVALAAILVSCSEETPAPEANSPSEIVEFVGGTIELTGRLANTPAGGLQIMATSPGLATPLVQKCVFEGLTRTSDGTLLVPFSLGSHSGMNASRAIPLEVVPSELSLKVSYSATGYVEGIEPQHTINVAVKVGDSSVRLRMEPQEAPASRPSSRPASRPVVAED